ncbi:hypothetical protein ACFYWU_40755 [Streptomyces chrestomyceticus]|uniref:hypothetical protein n=1 Tax=Streptomyces chrestomyceticus TaxID=68185 RepID=UPI0036C5261F
MSTPEDQMLVGRCYTKARRHRAVIGRLPGGGHLWGGPYTVPQFAVAGAALGLMLLTSGLWARHGIVDVLPLLAVPYGLALAVGRIRHDGRNPLATVASALGLLAGGGTGRLQGRPVRQRRPAALAGLCSLSLQPPLSAAQPPAPADRARPHAAAPPPAAAADRPARVASGVQALLAARTPSAISGPPDTPSATSR